MKIIETEVNKRGKKNRGYWKLTIYTDRNDEIKAKALDTYAMVCSCGTWNPEKQDFDWPGDPRYYGPPKYIRKKLKSLMEEYASEPKPSHSGGPVNEVDGSSLSRNAHWEEVESSGYLQGARILARESSSDGLLENGR